MQVNLNLSENLILHYIEENMIKNGNLVSVELHFSFFDKPGTAYVVIDNLEDENPNYAMTEITSELSDSFNDLLEDDFNWEIIQEKIRLYVTEWKKENE